MIRVLIGKPCQGIDSIAGPWHMKLHVRHPEVEMVVNGSLYHIQPVEFMYQIASFFKRILRTYNKPHLIDVSIFQHRIGYDQVTDVDGVKGTKEEAYIQRELPV